MCLLMSFTDEKLTIGQQGQVVHELMFNEIAAQVDYRCKCLVYEKQK